MNMKPITTLIFLLMVACSSPDAFVIIGPDGSMQKLMPTPAMLGGKRTMMYSHRTAYDETKIAITQDNEKSFDTAAAAAGLAYGGYLATKEVLADTAAGVTNKQTAAGVTKAGIAADVTKTQIGADVTKEAIKGGITTIPR